MQRRGGGGGGGGKGGGGGAAAARQLLLSLFDGALADRGHSLRRAQGSGKGGGKQGNSARPRDGEWSCHCGFATNRPHREACYVCGRSRDVAEVGRAAQFSGAGSRGATGGKGHRNARVHDVGEGDRVVRGPIGADGKRPLLGGSGRQPLVGAAGGGHGKGSADVPAWKGKGPSWGATTGHGKGHTGATRDLGTKGGARESDRGGGKPTTNEGCDDGRCAWTRPQPVLDEEGYELVQPRRVRADKGGPKGGNADGAPATKGATDMGAAAVEARRLWSDDSDDEDWPVDDDGDGEDGEGGDADGGNETPDPKQLRNTYEGYAKAVKDMEKRGTYGPAIDTMRQARDAAEEAWRQAKAPAPLPRRLDWAETKLRRAQAALTRARLALDRFDDEMERQRADLLERIQVADSWCKWRQQQLDDIHQEAAARVPGRRNEGPHCGGATEVRERLRGHVLPEMQAILEEVQEGSAVHERLALLVAGLADAEAKLGEQRDVDGPARYDLYDDDSLYDGWQEGHQPTAEAAGGAAQDEDPRDDQGRARPAAEWRPEGPGRWSRADAGRRGALQAQAKGRATTGESPLNQGMEGEAGGRGLRQSDTPANADGEAASSRRGAGPEEEDDDGGRRAGKHRRRQTDAEAMEAARAAEDARRAEELHRHLQAATAAQEQSYREGSGGFGSEAALSAAAQKFVLDVQKAQAQAHEMGVEARAEDGRALLQLSPAELRQWTEKNLEGGDGMRD